LPQVLSQEEVARLIDAAEFPFHRILLMTLYATGARRAEVAHLKRSSLSSEPEHRRSKAASRCVTVFGASFHRVNSAA
jgi:site-specific recombinase XerD